ncbi:unnamed protein product [Owenia fusiformis]|uniref:Uncharacterized protein n=1 Tax=Owenia fusiformis TaxID=6347 RepID=A0A8S4P2T1_OWEFU|nr:unnamed protein product [Owenia fusiformis]
MLALYASSFSNCLQMADKTNFENLEISDDKSAADDPKKPLADFIKEHYDKQKAEGKIAPSDDISDERANNFFNRAIQESQRMNEQTAKCNAKTKKLYEEFGKDAFESWQNEHAAHVLTPEEQHLIKQNRNGQT